MSKTIIIGKKGDKLLVCADEDKLVDYNNDLDMMGNIVQTLLGKPDLIKNKQIFIIDKPTISLKYRKDMAHVMFELLGISAFYIATQSMLVLYDNDIVSGIVVDLYDEHLYSVPICEEKLIKKAIKKVKINNENIGKIEQKNLLCKKQCKIREQNDIGDTVVYSTFVVNSCSPTFNNLTKDGMLFGDPISGAKKITKYLDKNKSWITKEKYKETGCTIIGKKCCN